MPDEDVLSKPHIIVEGNPVDGFTFTGPFDDHATAVQHVEEHLWGGAGGNWWIAPLQAP